MIAAKPDVINHNMEVAETAVSRNCGRRAIIDVSLQLLSSVAFNCRLFPKAVLW
ncbi:MAG: hypothetical protein MZU91_09900 [Desulfosudis oleivorans]|nr:hypothetical protein [Desulfosudis oleivorans]